MGFPSGSVVKNLPALQEMQETHVRSFGGRYFGEGSGNSLQYSCWERSMDRRAFSTIVPIGL